MLKFYDNRLAIVAIIILPCILWATANPCAWAQKAPASSADMAIDSLSAHVAFLGSDALAGRATGTVGGELAAQYIAYVLSKYRIAPFGEATSYFQSIPMHGSLPLPSSKLVLWDREQSYTLRWGKDYVLYTSGAQTFVPTPTPLVFVGYGIVAPEYDYNDYAGIDVSGKIVVFLDGEPLSDDPHYFQGALPTIYGYADAKQRIAISRGARGSILVPHWLEAGVFDWEKWSRQFYFEDVTLAYSVAHQLSLAVHPAVGRLLFDRAAYNFDQVLEMARKQQLQSFPLNWALSFRGEFKQREFLAKNVIAWLEGRHRQRKKEYLILSAHYDHLGIGPPVAGDSIYNGVGDNAIGVAGLLEIARALKQQEQKWQRSVIFLFTTGEEKGLLGASYYLDHAPVPHHKTIAHINIDGLALFDEFREVVAVGAEYSTLGHMLQQVAEKMELKVVPPPLEFTTTQSFLRSDQMAFAVAGIPALLIMEGPSYRRLTREQGIAMMMAWSDQRYHHPSDDLSQPIYWPAVQQHCRVIAALAEYLLAGDQTPQWYPGSPFINARLQSFAKKR